VLGGELCSAQAGYYVRFVQVEDNSCLTSNLHITYPIPLSPLQYRPVCISDKDGYLLAKMSSCLPGCLSYGLSATLRYFTQGTRIFKKL
jgi:hypothetical protein